MLSSKPGKEAYVKPAITEDDYKFTVNVGIPKDHQAAIVGTKLARANFTCLISGAPISGDYIKAEAQAGRMGERMMAIVAEGLRARVYLAPTPDQEAVALKAEPTWKPDVEFFQQALGFRVGNYGMTKWSDLFTDRQLVALGTFSDIVKEARERAREDALLAGLPDDERSLDIGGVGAAAYADAIAVYLAFAADKAAEGSSSLCTWSSLPTKLHVVSTFGRQALQMTWDYAEANVFADSSGNILRMSELVANVIERQNSSAMARGQSDQRDAAHIKLRGPAVISTDPPYYDNIGYADLSDFFYVWLRKTLKPIFTSLFGTLAVPKTEELVATPDRHGGKDKAEAFFLGGMTEAMHRLAEQSYPGFPVTVYYAFKQSETENDAGTASTGWETFLDAIIQAGFGITGTWPVRTDRAGGFRNKDRNSLASSIVLVCRPRPADSIVARRQDFVNALKAELPVALAHLTRANIAPVDLAQAAIGPGMAIYTRYSKVLDAQGKVLLVREALRLINRTLDESLAEQEGDFDADSRWALAWFDHVGFAEGEYGVAETLSTAKNTSVAGLVEAGIVTSSRGRVRLLKAAELARNWDPSTDPRLTAWETVHHLVRTLEAGGEDAAAALVSKLGEKAEIARELCYRLYALCERKKRAAEAMAYNGLVLSWPEITRLAREGGKPRVEQSKMFDETEE